MTHSADDQPPAATTWGGPPRPATGSRAGFGLEVWLVGTPAELDAAEAALAAIGHVRWAGIGPHRQRDRLSGADAGRCRTYLWLGVRSGDGIRGLV